MKNIILSTALMSSSLLSFQVMAWTEHGLLTREALSEVKELESLPVVYETLESVLPKMKLAYDKDKFGPATTGDPNAISVIKESDLNLYLRIKRDSEKHRGFIFEPRINERPGKKISALDVLSHYADEPDGWHGDTHVGDEPDTFLFDEDQYGDILWRAEFAMMGGKDSTASQAFRHMWWAPWNPMHPIATFKLPFNQLKKSMGEAHERLQTYLVLSRSALKAGSRYWQLRFLSNGLHYLQDCTQAFHVSQTPSKQFLKMATKLGGWEGGNFKLADVTTRATNIVSYYHWAYENFIGRIFKDPSRYSKAHAEFKKALRAKGSVPMKYSEEFLMDVAHASIVRSPVAAKTAMAFFPKIPKSVNLTTFKPGEFMNDEWWNKVETSAQVSSKEQKKYFSSVVESFKLFGDSVRTIVAAEVK